MVDAADVLSVNLHPVQFMLSLAGITSSDAYTLP